MPTYEKKLTDLKSELKIIEDHIKPLETKVKSGKEFQRNQEMKKKEEEKLKNIGSKKNEIKILQDKNPIEKLEKEYKLLFEKYKKIINENEKYSDIDSEKELKLTSKIKFNDKRFEKNFVEKIDKRKPLNQTFNSNIFNEENVFQYNPKQHLKKISSVLQKIIDKKIKFNTGFNEKNVLDSLFDDYFSIDYDLIQDGDSLLQMSPGKVGIVLFQLFLHLSNSTDPILIDQPEDNLDNRTVYDELNNFVKSKKKQRQIIIVSHNPNLVVSTDSDNIIVANQKGQNKSGKNKKYKFEYVNGAIEHSFSKEREKGILFQKGIREHICCLPPQ